MSTWIDNEFAYRAFSHLPRFVQINNSSMYKLRFRCPVCGDSQTDDLKARGWYYGDGGNVHCYNCDYHAHIKRYLNEFEPDLYREYILEVRKDQVSRPTPAPAEKKIEPEKKIIQKLNFCDRIDSLPKNHPIVKYVENRKIPQEAWNRLWFTREWPKLVNSVNPGTYKNEMPEPRLVIPIFNKDNKIESFQGRALRKDAPQKYITIKAYPEATKIYGVERINDKQDVFVLEGPLDSLFINNSIAITGGSLDLSVVPFKEQRVWIMDHEPRHEDTVKRMKRLVDAGERIVFWDNWNYPGKDINEFVKNGASLKEIHEYINLNIAQGLMAKMRLGKYAKI